MRRSERLLARGGAGSGQGNFVLGFRKPQGLDSPILGTAALPQSCPGADVGVGGGQALPWLQCLHHLCAKAEPCCPPYAASTPKSLTRGIPGVLHLPKLSPNFASALLASPLELPHSGAAGSPSRAMGSAEVPRGPQHTLGMGEVLCKPPANLQVEKSASLGEGHITKAKEGGREGPGGAGELGDTSGAGPSSGG